MSRSAYERAGSSPRVRGKRRPVREDPGDRGLIPARAGKTRSTGTSSRTGRAHPRACGENRRNVVGGVAPPGSSPRVRGKRTTAARAFKRWGLIPARAGKTVRVFTAMGLVRAHPRACGENDHVAQIAPAGAGSSPRVRGKLDAVDEAVDVLGLIPARAGKTRRYASGRVSVAAHPRACGENARVRAGRGRAGGSSPRVRGKLTYPRNSLPEGRLIPACAGKTRR